MSDSVTAPRSQSTSPLPALPCPPETHSRQAFCSKHVSCQLDAGCWSPRLAVRTWSMVGSDHGADSYHSSNARNATHLSQCLMAMRARSVPFDAHSSFACIAAAFTSSEAGCHDGGSCRDGAPVGTKAPKPVHAHFRRRCMCWLPIDKTQTQHKYRLQCAWDT